MTHTIRLRGCWETISDRARTTHSRKFGRPRTLDAGERVWLVCTEVPGVGEVTVNGELVGRTREAGRFAADITGKLRERNVVELTVESAAPIGEVTLEIRPHLN